MARVEAAEREEVNPGVHDRYNINAVLIGRVDTG